MQTKYPDFWNVIYGDLPPGAFWAYVLILLLCTFGALFVSAAIRFKKNPETPPLWSTEYFIKNNKYNFIAGLLLAPIFFWLETKLIINPAVLAISCVGIGFGFERLTVLANNLGYWTTNELSKKLAKKIKTEQTEKLKTSNNEID